MLICNQAYMDGKTIMCKRGNICVHVRYCAVSMKYYQTDNAKECVMRYEDGKKHQTSKDD